MDLLTEEVITTGLAADSRDGVIAELAELLVAQGLIARDSVEAALKAVHDREASQSTGLGASVAIPHGLSPHVEEVVAALGLHPTGVDWGAVDGAPVRLVILLIVPPNKFQAHVRTLAGIARVLNDADLRRLILDAKDAATVLDILIEREEAAFH